LRSGETKVNHEHKVENLLLRLLDQVDNGSSPSGSLLADTEAGNHAILFDVELNGCHYTLPRSSCPDSEPQIALSPREQEVVRLVAKGHSNKAIAAVLEISPWTVSTHLRRVFAKLGVSSRAEMVACALRDSLLG
jgi:DNA-binding CsgD family transcriptional regulator